MKLKPLVRQHLGVKLLLKPPFLIWYYKFPIESLNSISEFRLAQQIKFAIITIYSTNQGFLSESVNSIVCDF